MRNIKFYWTIILLLCRITSYAQWTSQPVYPLEESPVDEGRLPAHAMYILTTVPSDTVFSDIQSKIIQPMNRSYGDLRIRFDSIQWLRFIFKNATKDSSWQLTIQSNDVRQSVLFDKLGKKLDRGGYSAHAHKLGLNEYCNLSFQLSPHATDTFYLLINNPRFRIASYIHVNAQGKQKWNRFNGYLAGKMEMILLLYVLFTMVLLSLKREWLYFWYLMYALGVYLYYLASSGVGIWQYWGHKETWIPIAVFIAAGWTLVAFFLTMRTFLELQNVNACLDRVLQIMIGMIAVIIIVSFPVELTQVYYDFMNGCFAIGLLMLVCGAGLKLYHLPKTGISRNRLWVEWLTFSIPIPVFLSILLILYCESDLSGHRIEWVYNEFPEYAIIIEIFLMSILLGGRVYAQQLQMMQTKHILNEYKLEFEVTLHHFLKQNALLIKSDVEKNHRDDINLQNALQFMIDTCDLSRTIIDTPNLVELLQIIKDRFNHIAKSDSDEPLLTLLGDENLDLQNINLSIPIRNKLYWILWSALWNIKVHSKCRYATLKIQFLLENPKKLELILKDNGMGLPCALNLEIKHLELNLQNYEALCDQYFPKNKFGVRSYFSIAASIKADAILTSNSNGTTLQIIFFQM